jgi:hypothetical protein
MAEAHTDERSGTAGDAYLYFSSWTLDLRTGELRRGGSPVQLRRQLPSRPPAGVYHNVHTRT